MVCSQKTFKLGKETDNKVDLWVFFVLKSVHVKFQVTHTVIYLIVIPI